MTGSLLEFLQGELEADEFETDAERLDGLKDAGAEQFETGHASPLWAIFGYGYASASLGDIEVESREPVLEACRDVDIAEHGLQKGDTITRVQDGAQYRVRRIEPDGAGMSVVRLRG